MEWWQRILAFSHLIRLDAISGTALDSSLRGLKTGERGWITIKEAQLLFSSMGGDEGLSNRDREGRLRLSQFAVDVGHRSTLRWRDGRVIFNRNRTPPPAT